jgi:hypothetical protein
MNTQEEKQKILKRQRSETTDDEEKEEGEPSSKRLKLSGGSEIKFSVGTVYQLPQNRFDLSIHILNFKLEDFDYDIVELPQYNWDGTLCTHRLNKKIKIISFENHNGSKNIYKFVVDFDLSEIELQANFRKFHVFPPCFIQATNKVLKYVVYSPIFCGNSLHLYKSFENVCKNGFRLFYNNIPVSNLLMHQIQQDDKRMKELGKELSSVLYQCFSFVKISEEGKDFTSKLCYKLKEFAESEIVQVKVDLSDLINEANPIIAFVEILLSSDQTTIIRQALKQCFPGKIDVTNLIRYLEWDRLKCEIRVKKVYKSHIYNFQLDAENETKEGKMQSDPFWMADCQVFQDLNITAKLMSITIAANLFYNYEKERDILLQCMSNILDLYYIIYDYWNPKLLISSLTVEKQNQTLLINDLHVFSTSTGSDISLHRGVSYLDIINDKRKFFNTLHPIINCHFYKHYGLFFFFPLEISTRSLFFYPHRV